MDYNYFPMTYFESLDNAHLLEDLSWELGGDPDKVTEEEREFVRQNLSRTEYLQFLIEVLQVANDLNQETFSESDPDIEALIKYLNALEEQAE